MFPLIIFIAFVAACARIREPEEAPDPAGECDGCHSPPQLYTASRDCSQDGPAPEFSSYSVRGTIHGKPVDPGRPSGITKWGFHDAHLRSCLTTPLTCSECHLDVPFVSDPGHIDSNKNIPSPNRPGITYHRNFAEIFFGDASRARMNGFDASYDPETKSCKVACHGTEAALQKPDPVWSNEENPLAGKGCDVCHDDQHHLEDRQYCPACHTEVIGPDGNIVSPNLHINGEKNVGDVSCKTCHPASVLPQSHASHLQTLLTGAITCTDCHKVPENFFETTHIDGDGRAEVTLGESVYDPDSKTCSDVACHGPALSGTRNPTPPWGTVRPAAEECTLCHDPVSHKEPTEEVCYQCHPATVNENKQIIDQTLHGSGAVEFAPCDIACHETEGSALPPLHPQHLDSTIQGAFTCYSCHDEAPRMGGAPLTASHPDGAKTVAFGEEARRRGHHPAYDVANQSCQDGPCHDPTLSGAPADLRWVADFREGPLCRFCHNPTNHPEGTADRCDKCHSETAGPEESIDHPEKHNGPEESRSIDACTGQCHDITGEQLPPPHATHLATDVMETLSCPTCHEPAPTPNATPLLPTHPDNRVALRSDLGFESASRNCSAACHNETTPAWSEAPPVETQTCRLCHGLESHPEGVAEQCEGCHPATAGESETIAHPDKHGDGVVEKEIACDACHGTPPSTGAHRKHTEGVVNLFAPIACNTCHTVPSDPLARGHLDGDGRAEVNLRGLAAANNFTPSYDPATQSCVVYCHQGASPAWTEGFSGDLCGSCHDFPPAGDAHDIATQLGLGCDYCHGSQSAQTHMNGVVNGGGQ